MSYEAGKAPAGAPVTWRRHEDSESIYVVTLGRDAADEPSEIDVYDECYADAICRAFHDAKLAGEAKNLVLTLRAVAVVDGRDGTVSDANDWLRRYDAAKGD